VTPQITPDGLHKVVCVNGLVPTKMRDPERWGYVRLVRNTDFRGRIGGGVRLSPIHTIPTCGYLNRGYEGDNSEIIRVLLANVDGHPVLEAVGMCKWCQAMSGPEPTE